MVRGIELPSWAWLVGQIKTSLPRVPEQVVISDEDMYPVGA